MYTESVDYNVRRSFPKRLDAPRLCLGPEKASVRSALVRPSVRNRSSVMAPFIRPSFHPSFFSHGLTSVYPSIGNVFFSSASSFFIICRASGSHVRSSILSEILHTCVQMHACTDVRTHVRTHAHTLALTRRLLRP